MVTEDSQGDFAADTSVFTISAIAVGIGAISAVVAKILFLLICFFTNLFYFQRFSLKNLSPANSQLGWVSILIPALGGLIIGLMARYGSDRIRGHGIPEALEAILFGQSKMSPKVAILKPLSSAISIGSGGPFGAEGPIIMTGGAFGSIIAQMFHLTAAERKTLLVAGAAAGMSAIFASPVAAVLLAVELLLFEWKPRSLIPVALASAVSAVFRTYFFGLGPLFPVASHAAPGGEVIFCAAIVGLVAGALSMALSVLVYRCEDLFSKLPIHWMWWPMLGGLFIGIGGYFQPRALGVGYDVISDFLNGHVEPRAVIALVLVKAAIWTVALGSGTSGGVLAPLLIFGGGLGVLFQTVLPAPSHSFWPLIMMAAVLGGMMRSPFTGTIFAFELTQDIHSLLALMTASITAYGFTVLYMKRSILTEKVARRGFHVFREYSVDMLERIHADEVMTRKVEAISADVTVSKAREQYFGKDQRHLAYPTLDSNGNLIGMITRAELLNASDRSHLTLKEIVDAGFPRAFPKDSCRRITEILAHSHVTAIPIVDSENPGTLLGLVTLSDLLKPRALEIHEEQGRERPIKIF